LPVPIRPPAIAIAAAIANNGFVNPSLEEVDVSWANACVNNVNRQCQSCYCNNRQFE
jgi:hypothetical protein